MTWLFIQRMTRLAASQHKVWVRLSLTPGYDQAPSSIEELSDRINKSTLQINSYEVRFYKWIVRIALAAQSTRPNQFTNFKKMNCLKQTHNFLRRMEGFVNTLYNSTQSKSITGYCNKSTIEL